MHHAHTVPPAPSTRTETPIPPELDRLVLRCLAKDPAGRPQSAKELAGELEAMSDAHAWTDVHARSWWTKHLPAAK